MPIGRNIKILNKIRGNEGTFSRVFARLRIHAAARSPLNPARVTVLTNRNHRRRATEAAMSGAESGADRKTCDLFLAVPTVRGVHILQLIRIESPLLNVVRPFFEWNQLSCELGDLHGTVCLLRSFGHISFDSTLAHRGRRRCGSQLCLKAPSPFIRVATLQNPSGGLPCSFRRIADDAHKGSFGFNLGLFNSP